jgi:hypothetical protein
MPPPGDSVFVLFSPAEWLTNTLYRKAGTAVWRADNLKFFGRGARAEEESEEDASLP